jgi:hypothetical protein
LGAVVGFDGYVSNENYPEAVKALQVLRETGLRELKEEERDEFDKITQWIRDLK